MVCSDFSALNRSVWSVCFSPDGKRVASGSSENAVRIWHASTGQSQSTLTVDSEVTSVAFSPDGSKIAAAHSNEIQIFDTETQAKLGSPLSGHSHVVTSVAWNNDGSKLATGSYDNSIKVWAVGSAGTFECHSTLSGHSGYVTAVSYSCSFSNVWCVLTIEYFTDLSGVFVSVQMANKLLLEATTKP